MRLLSRVVLTLGVLALVVAVAPAQQQGGRGRGGFGGIGALLDSKDVQKELNLTDDQVEKAKKVATEVREKHQDDFAKLRDVPMEERFQKMMALGKEVTDETLKGLGDTLKPEQTKRLKQLLLQQQVQSPFGGGPSVFLTPDVEEALKLTDKQKDDLKTMAEDFRKDVREAFQGAGQGGDRQELAKKMASMRKEAMDNALKVLDDKQKATWEELTGKPVDFPLSGFGGRRQRDNQ
jgi:hypothetical protein